MTIFTNGCFDILHRGHVELFKYCGSLAIPAMGGHVVVGLNSDESVKRLKGNGRPINNELDRKFILESLSCVDKVIIFNEDTPRKLIEKIKPDFIVKGSEAVPEEEEVTGFKVKLFNHVRGHSTTKTIENLL